MDTVKEINGEMINQDQLVDIHSGLVYNQCYRLLGAGQRVGFEFGDLASLGFIGLIKAFRRFDREKFDVRFSTYATPLIWGEILSTIRDQNVIVKYPRRIKELAWDIVKMELENEPTEVISKSFPDISHYQIIEAVIFLDNQTLVSTDMEINDEESDITLGDLFGYDDDFTLYTSNEFLDTLSERERIIIEGRMDGLTQVMIGDKIGTSQVQVSRIVKRIKNKYLKWNELS